MTSKRWSSSASQSQEASNRGAFLHLDGDLAGAKQAYEEALAADPDNATALNNLGFLYAQEGRLDEAESLYVRAIELNPVSSTARANLGNVRALKGDVHGAVRRFTRGGGDRACQHFGVGQFGADPLKSRPLRAISACFMWASAWR